MRNEVSLRKKASLKLRIAVDLLGGEIPPQKWLDSLSSILRFPCPVDIYLFIPGNQKLQIPSLKNISFTLVNASVISMKDSPVSVRTKKSSSIVQGMRALQQKNIDGFLSTGNTGAIVAGATLYMKKLPDVTRPSLLAFLPSKKKPLGIIDVGANVDDSPEHIFSFSRLGIAAQQALGIENPRIALLNIGSEQHKGSEELRSCYQLLQKFPNFIGNVEGNSLFEGNIDLLVTNGFTGNIIVKSIEGFSSFMLDILNKKGLLPNDLNKKDLLPYKLFPNTFIEGAILVGIDGMVMKCHGNAQPSTITNALDYFLKLLKKEFLINYKNHYQKNYFRLNSL